MRNCFLAAAALGATVLSAGAFGQVEHTPIDATPYNISVKGSIFLPIADNLEHVDNMFAGLGLEYLFPTQIIRGSETFLEADFLLRTTASSNVTIIPLTINQRFYTNGGIFGGGHTYFYLGGGVTWIDPHGQAKLTGHAGLGTDIGPKTFVEAAFYFSEQDQNGLRNTGVALSLGYRF